MTFFTYLFSACLAVGLLSADPVDTLLKQKILQNTPPSWMVEQIEHDLSALQPSLFTTEALEKTVTARSPYDLLLIRYQIKDGKLFIHSTTPWAKDNFRNGQLTDALKEMVAICQGKFRLPDCDFIVCLQDYYEGTSAPAPILVFSKKPNAVHEVLFPDTEMLSQGERFKKAALQGNAKYPWEKKIDKAYWRGASTGFLGTFTPENYLDYPRFKLVHLSIQNPEWLDARFHWLCQGAENLRDAISDYVGHSLGIPDHMYYKYQILVDGNSCAWARTYWQLFCNSVIFKHDSEWIEYYYRALQPYVHYIPTACDFSDLGQAIAWAKEHDQEAKQISQNAQRFAQENLERADILYYIYLLLNRYAALQQIGIRSSESNEAAVR